MTFRQTPMVCSPRSACLAQVTRLATTWRRTLPLGLSLSAALAMSSCKTSARDVGTNGNRATLTVTLSGLQPSDENQPGYTYELSGCVLTPVDGSLVAQDTVSITAAGITNGLQNCSFAVKTYVAQPNITIMGSDKTVLYQQTSLPALALDLNGRLTVLANLQAMFTTGNGATTVPPPASPPATSPAAPGTGSSISVNFGGGSGSGSGSGAASGSGSQISIQAESGTCIGNAHYDPTTFSCI